MTKRVLLIGFGALVLALATAAYVSRAELSALAFELTGEEEPLGQVRGVAQYALNITRAPLRLEPYAEIEHAAVSPFGINTFLHQEVEVAKREESLRLISEAGFDWIRQEFPWEDIEISGKGDFIDRRNDPEGVDAWAKYDNIVDLAEQYDLDIIARVDNPPAWSRSGPPEETGTFAPPDDFDDFAEYAAILAERYAGRITYYQIWNEPNIYPEWGEQNVDPVAYTDLLCRTYEAVKLANPEAIVITGALAPTSELSGRDFNDFLFLQRMYEAGAADCFDVLAVQGYGLFSGPTDRRLRPVEVNYGRNRYIRDIMVRSGDAEKAIWVSEMNWNAAPEDVEPRFGRVTEEQQARFAPIAYERAQEDWPWVGVINFWYWKRADDEWLRERRPEAYFQMAEPDFTLLPVYESMAEYANQPPVVYRGNHPPDHWAIDYGQGNQPVSFIFQGNRLEIRFESVEAFDCGLALRIDDQPVVVADGCSGTLTWRGTGDRHDVEIELLGSTALTRIIVRDEPNLAPPIAIGAVVLLMITLGFILRSVPAEPA